MLVVRQRGKIGTLPPLRQVPPFGVGDQKTVGEGWEGLCTGVAEGSISRLLFRDERATPALLEFLEDTRVGRMPGLALFHADGPRVDEENLEEVEIRPTTGEESGEETEGEEGGPGPP